jgi:hypothetical protein
VVAARRKSAARRTGARGSRRAGIAVAGGVILVVILAGVLLTSSPGTSPLDQSAVGTIQRAISTVPATDVGGADVPGLPRPPGAIRAYYLRNAAITTVIYSQHGDVPSVATGVQAKLRGGAWAAVGGDPGAASSQAWRGVFARGNDVAQVSVVLNSRVVSTTYIVQASQQ